LGQAQYSTIAGEYNSTLTVLPALRPDPGDLNMVQILTDNPWLMVCMLAAVVIVACTAITCIPDYLRRSHQAEIDAALKQDMLNRGMSAADIKTVLEASTDGEALRLVDSQPVRVGLGKFHVEVGNVRRPVTESPGAQG
jgi:hypothetical protein